MRFVDAADLETVTVVTESVIVRGRLVPVPDDETLLAQRAIAANATVPALDVSPDTPIEELDCLRYRLPPEELSGQWFDPPDGLCDRTGPLGGAHAAGCEPTV